MLKRFFFIPIFLFTGCASVPSVKVSHLFFDNDAALQQFESMTQIYLVIHKPKDWKGKKLGVAVDQIGGTTMASFQGLSDFNSHRFALNMEKDLNHRGLSLLAYRVQENPNEIDPFISELNPSAILNIDISAPSFEDEHSTEETNVKNANGEMVKKVTNKSKFTCQIYVTAQLTSVHDQKNLFSKSRSYSSDKEVMSESSDSQMTNELVEELVNETLDWVAEKLAQEICSYKVTDRERRIFVEKNDQEMEKAFRLVKNGKWNSAEDIWTKRLSEKRGSWKDQWNLAVIAEARYDYSTAEARYKQIKREEMQDAEVNVALLDSVLADLALSQFLRTKQTKESEKWFAQPIAVLPFSDEVVSLDGPDLVRKFVHSFLTLGGYNTIPLDDVDERLKQKGFSDGGQLVALKPEKIAEWVKAERTLSGNITEYNNVNVGIYQKRIVEGTMSVWDRSQKKEIWNSSEQVKNDFVMLNKEHPFMGFFLGLGASWIEKMAKKPLAPEAQAFVAYSLDSFPLKPFEWHDSE